MIRFCRALDRAAAPVVVGVVGESMDVLPLASEEDPKYESAMLVVILVMVRREEVMLL